MTKLFLHSCLSFSGPKSIIFFPQWDILEGRRKPGNSCESGRAGEELQKGADRLPRVQWAAEGCLHQASPHPYKLRPVSFPPLWPCPQVVSMKWGQHIKHGVPCVAQRECWLIMGNFIYFVFLLFNNWHSEYWGLLYYGEWMIYEWHSELIMTRTSQWTYHHHLPPVNLPPSSCPWKTSECIDDSSTCAPSTLTCTWSYNGPGGSSYRWSTIQPHPFGTFN